MTSSLGGAAVGDALEAAIDAFAAAGLDTPRLDAEVLVAAATGIGRAQLIADPEREVEPAAARRFSQYVRRRLRREPVAYILGRKGFRHIELAVGPGVLIPRPETELLVELAVELEPREVVDVGTGSGAVALAVADELPACRVIATDTSHTALERARSNAARLGLRDRVELREGTLPPAGRYDLVLANLPYVADGEELAPEIAMWEPKEALYAGPTGLDAFEAVLGQLSVSGVEAGAIGLEVGLGQAAAVAELVRRTGFERVEVREDLAGIERVVVGSSKQ